MNVVMILWCYFCSFLRFVVLEFEFDVEVGFWFFELWLDYDGYVLKVYGCLIFFVNVIVYGFGIGKKICNLV